MNKCIFSKAWGRVCNAIISYGDKYCYEHSLEKCKCGKQATHECSGYSGSWVCGYPLCETCRHNH